MTLRKPALPSLTLLFLLGGCSSGQTGDAGLGVDTNNKAKPGDTASDDTAMDDDTASGEPADADDDVSVGDDVGGPSGSDEPDDLEPANDAPGGDDDVKPMDAPRGDAGRAPQPGEAGAGDGAPLPGDVLTAGGLDCVAAHSTVRVLIGGYDGPLYRLAREDGSTTDIASKDGFADVESHDAFCADDACVIEVLFDQSGMGNDLTEAPPGSAKRTPGNPVDASELPVLVGGRSVYGMLFTPGMGYRKLVGNGTARGDDPQTLYMVTSQHDLINGCCFNYGNAQTTANNDGNGTSEALNFGFGVIWGTGSGSGPWVMADLENGLYAGWENGQDHNISTNTSLAHDFVTAVLVGDTAEKNDDRGRFALYGGDATAGLLTTMYDGIRPEKPGYVPMQKQGSVILGVAGDNSDGDGGRFYEGIMANGAASLETLEALQAAIVATEYGE